MASSINSPIDGADLASQADPTELWEKELHVYQQSEDFWKPFEGKDKSAPVCVKTDTKKGYGSTLNIRNMAGLYAAAKHGDDEFNTAADFEKVKINDYSVIVDVIRHGVRFNERAEEWMGIRGELEDGLPRELGKWLGREKTHKLWMMFRELGNSANTVYAGGRGSQDALLKTDTLTVDEVAGAGVQLKTLNGMPARMGTDLNGNPINKYAVASSVPALFSLKKDPDYKQQARDAGARGNQNVLFKGGYTELDGQFIKEYNPIDHDGDGPIGSPINPKAFLGAAITSATTSIDITGGGAYNTAATNTAPEYFRDFPDAAYTFTTTNTIAAATDDFYVIIYNVSGADKGKWGFYKCATNNKNKLTMKSEAGDSAGAGARLQAATSGNASTQIGNVVWSATENTDAHPSDSVVILANANGVPIGRTVVLGAGAAIRGYGKHDGKRGVETDEDGFIKEVYIRSYFGQTPRKDVLSRCPGYILVEHAIEYEGISIDPTLA
jgi:hypothetical protein